MTPVSTGLLEDAIYTLLNMKMSTSAGEYVDSMSKTQHYTFSSEYKTVAHPDKGE